MMLRFVLFIFAALFCINTTQCCYIWGTDSGYCETQAADLAWRQTYMPFCAEKVQYPACLPKPQFIPPTMEFPKGRWKQHNTFTKDKWVERAFFNWTRHRRAVELNKTLIKLGINEYGDSGKVIPRFTKLQDCQNSYKNYFCWINFPRCDPDHDLTLPTCRSACENFFIACGYSHDLWRCGKSKWFNGYFPESSSTNIKGNITYLRDYFPGQPFRQNKYTHVPTPHPTTQHGQELAICTPAITGGASSGQGGRLLLVMGMMLLAVIATCFQLL